MTNLHIQHSELGTLKPPDSYYKGTNTMCSGVWVEWS